MKIAISKIVKFLKVIERIPYSTFLGISAILQFVLRNEAEFQMFLFAFTIAYGAEIIAKAISDRPVINITADEANVMSKEID